MLETCDGDMCKELPATKKDRHCLLLQEGMFGGDVFICSSMEGHAAGTRKHGRKACSDQAAAGVACMAACHGKGIRWKGRGWWGRHGWAGKKQKAGHGVGVCKGKLEWASKALVKRNTNKNT